MMTNYMNSPPMNTAMLIRIDMLVDDDKCYETIRALRWSEGVYCPHCRCTDYVSKRGLHDRHPARQRYYCKNCRQGFDDLSGTIFEGHHQPVKMWVLCLYFMGLNLSGGQIAGELGLHNSDVYMMTVILRSGVVENRPPVLMHGEAECDEVYITAGHKGQPAVVSGKGREGRRNRLKGARGRGTAETERPPVFGMKQRNGEVRICLCDNVQQHTIKPLILTTIAPGTMIYTDEYAIYNRLQEWGYSHKTVCHGSGEYARDEDGDGFHEVHVNTVEGFWSLLRSWLRPHRGISQDKLPLYLGFFEFVHNAKKRGKALLGSLLRLLLQPTLATPQNTI